MKRVKTLLSIFLVLLISLSSVVSAFAAEVIEVDNKIADSLKSMILNCDSNTIPVCIFLKECNKDKVLENVEDKYHYNVDAYENKAQYYQEVVPNIVVGDKKISEMVGTKNITTKLLSLDSDTSNVDVEVRKHINNAIVNDSNQYLACYRREVANIVDDYVSEFVTDNTELIEEIILQPKSGEFVIANVIPENIGKIARLPDVKSIDYFENLEAKSESCAAVPLIETDSYNGLGSSTYNSGSGYDGAGITIGIIESEGYVYEEDNCNLEDAHLEFVETPGVLETNDDPHATTVTALICGKKININGEIYEGAAKEATVFQTAIVTASEFIKALEMFAEMNVDVVNFSGGFPTAGNYDAVDKLADNILENNRLLLVTAAGNNVGYVHSPGKAYNALTVGNLQTRDENGALESAPYKVSRISGRLHREYLANKPDVVAPGCSIYLPVSSEVAESRGTGTSFSTPLVTAMVAQIMQSDCFAIFNPNAAKNYIICGASNSLIKDTNVSYGNLTRESGAGLVNGVNSFECSNLATEYYGVYLASQNAPTEYKTVARYDLSKGDNLRIALTFEKEENIPLEAAYGNNIDIRLVRDNPYSTYLVKSESLNNNVELIDTKITTTGEYCLQIRLTDSILDVNENNDLHYWISWRVY